MTCILCGSAVFKKHELDGLTACAECGLVRRSGQLPDASVYYASHMQYERDLHIPGKAARRAREAGQHLALLRAVAAPQRYPRLLEVGCHEGLFLRAARGDGFTVFGIEPNVAAATSAGGDGIPIFCGMLENYAPTEAFDVVVAFHVLEHLSDPCAGLRRMASFLRSGGVLALEVPNIESFAARREKGKWAYITPEHFFYFSPRTLTRMLAASGLRPLRLRQRDYDLYHAGIRDLLVRLGLSVRPAPESANSLTSAGPGSAASIPERGIASRLIAGIVRRLLAGSVVALGRQNFIFALARKI